MTELSFELTNEQRRCFGLVPVEKHWECFKLKDMFLYFDGDIICKKISIYNDSYLEQELNEKTSDNRTVLLPKTAKGKPKKLNYTATQSFSPFGVYFYFSKQRLRIANYTTQTTFYSEEFDNEKNYEDLQMWIKQWISESTEADLQEVEAFRTAKRMHCKFKEGDFFTFKIGRRNWGVGRILLDVAKYRKTPEFEKEKNYGLKNLMGRALIVKIYHKISDTHDFDIDELTDCLALPSQAIMDNIFYYGECKIIGHKALTTGDHDMLISYGQSISAKDPHTVYLQYGLIYKEKGISLFNKYLLRESKNTMSGFDVVNPYRKEGIGFGLDIRNLQQCIEAKSNQPYWENSLGNHAWDLRNPSNIDIKREIFQAFGLDADKSYEENLRSTERTTNDLA